MDRVAVAIRVGRMVAMPSADSPLSEALQRVGDRWSFLIVDALLGGSQRFNDLSKSVPGIAPNILIDRLRRLEGSGVVASEAYSERPLRHEYRLTDEGRELAGVLRLLTTWGGRRESAEGLHHSACGTSVEARWYCPTCARVLEEDEDSDLRRL
jgi:DNA-binding HxlR family transcriptional regulator